LVGAAKRQQPPCYVIERGFYKIVLVTLTKEYFAWLLQMPSLFLNRTKIQQYGVASRVRA